MEKGPKIEKNFGGNEAIPEFQSKSYDKGLENEQDNLEQKESKKSDVLKESLKKDWPQIMIDSVSDFPQPIQIILKKKVDEEHLTEKENRQLEHARSVWWKSKGLKFNLWDKLHKKELGIKIETKAEKRAKKILPKLKRFELIKKQAMESLRLSLQGLDKGEPVNEFRDETRKVIYFDEENEQYSVEENGIRKNVTIGDVLSDYAWGIKYVPDGEMTEPAYRTVAKRILVNEIRRDIENIHDKELVTIGQANPRYQIYPDQLGKLSKELAEKGNVSGIVGGLAEIQIRELLTRLSANNDLNFVVLRSDTQEDTEYKYDFKIRVKNKNRGIAINGSIPQQKHGITIQGFQLKTKTSGPKLMIARGGFPKKGKATRVEDIVTIKIRSSQLLEVFQKWISSGKPSGGPEQFFSSEFKVAILKVATEKLTDIPQEVFDKL